MSTLIVGDVHGCASELAQLVAVVRPRRVVLVGDLFTKGPDPVGVWRQVSKRGFAATLGNHEVRLIKAVDGKRRDPAALWCSRALTRADPDWLPWVRSLPLTIKVAGVTVVHAGLHPSGDIGRTKAKMATNGRFWPYSAGPEAPHWWQVFKGTQRVVFGHDAVHGLVVRRRPDGSPWLIGLDTGCVYGGSLTGYIVEEDAVVSIPAERAYHTINFP